MMDVEEGEAVEDFDGADHLDSIAQRLVEVLGDAQKEFEGGVYTDKLGSKFGGYGSFLPTELRAPSVLAQTKPATAAPTISNPKDKISPVCVGEQTKRMEIMASVTDAGRGGTSAVDKALVGQRVSASEHAVNSFLGLNGRNEEIQSTFLHSVVKEADFDRNTETNNANHCLSTSDRVATSVDVPFENTRSRGIATVGDTSSKRQNYGCDRDFDKMENKKATLITLRIKKNPEDSRRKNKPIYSGLGLNDSSSLSLEEEEDETYLSDAYSSPDLSPLTMIQVVMSRLQSTYHLVLSPLREVFGPPTDVKNTFLGTIKGSSIVLASAVQSSLDLENCLHKSESLTGSKICEGRDKKQNLQAKSKIKTAELKSTSSDGVRKALLQSEKTKFIQEITADTHTSLHEAAKECEGVEHEVVQDIRHARKNSGLTRDATETSVHNLDPSNQESAKELNASEMPLMISRKEKGKLKPKGRAITCESIEERNESRALEISVTYPKNTTETSLLVPEKEVQASVQRKEVCDASREANFLQKEGSNSHFHLHGIGKVDSIVGDEFGRDSSTKPGKREMEGKGHFERKDKSPILGSASSSKDVISNVKSDMIRKETSLKRPAEKMFKDVSLVKESSKDSLTVTDKKREGKKDLFKKVAKQSVFVLEKNAKEVVNVANREHEHVTTSSEYFETGMKNVGKNSKNNKLARKEFKATLDSGKDGKLLKESGTKNMDVVLAEKKSVEASFSNSERLNLSAGMTEPVPAASAPVPTLVLDNWVMCDKCGQWRLLLPVIDIKKLPKKFFCKMMTWLPGMNSCKFEEDETSNAVYAYLGIPNPKFAQLNASATQPLPASVPPVSLMPAPLISLNSSAVTEKTQETKRTTPIYKNSLSGKVAPVLSKPSSLSRKGDSGSMKSKNLNDVDHVFQDLDQARQELRVQVDDENNLSSLKPKRKQAKTSSVEELEGVPPVKKIKVAEAGNSYSLETYVVSSLPRENLAYNHDTEISHFHKETYVPSKCISKVTSYYNESKKIESSAALSNTGKPRKDGLFDEGATECKRLYQSRELEEQVNQGSPINAGGVNSKQHSSKLGEAKVDRKLKVRLKRDEDIQKDGKSRLEEDASNSQICNGKKMKSTDAYGINSRQIKGELGTRPPGTLRKDCLPRDVLHDKEQPKGTNGDEPEGSIRGTFSKTTYAHNEASARKMRRQQSVSSSPASSSSPVSSPESSTRRSKGLVSPVESTVSSPAKVCKADEHVVERSIPRNDNNIVSSSSGATYSVAHPRLKKPSNQDFDNHYNVSGPGKKNLRSRESGSLFTDEVGEVRPDSARDMNNACAHGACNALLDGSSNSDHNDYEQDESEEQHRVFPRPLETSSYDNHTYQNGRCSEHDGAEKLRERDGGNSRYDRNNDSIKERDFKRERDSHYKTSDKRTSDTDCDDWEERFTRQQKVQEARARVSFGETHSDMQFEFDLHGKKAGIKAGHVDRSASSEGKERLNDITCDIKQESRVRNMEGAGKQCLQFEQEDGLRTANGKCFSESCEKIGSLHWKEGKIGSARSSVGKLSAVTGTKESEAAVTRNVDEQHPLSKSDTRIRMCQDNGMSYAKTKSKNHTDLAVTTHCGENLAQGKELSKGIDEGPGSRNNFPRVSPANGHMIREGDVGVASSLKGQPNHQAGILIKEAKSLKHTADRLQGSEAIRGDIYLHAALKFLQGAAIWETSQDGGAKHDVLSLYNGTAKLCEYCATTLYAKDVKPAALALKCAAVARMRALQVKNPCTTRTLTELQATMQPANPSQLDESPSSSSASDVDNLNNQALPNEKLQGTSTAKELSSPLQASLSSIPASARHHPQITLFLQDAGEMCTAFEAWRRADHAIAAAKVSCSDAASPGDAIRRVGEISFSDVEILVRLVNSALEAIRP